MSLPVPSPMDVFRAAALRHRQLRRSPGYVGGPAALDFHVNKLMRAMAEGGQVRVKLDGDEARAMVAYLPGEFVPGSGRVTFVVAHQATGASEAAWLADQLDELGLPVSPTVKLCPWDVDLCEVFEARGFGLASVCLQGRSDVALARLLQLPQTSRCVEELVPGARLRRLRPDDLEAVIALYVEIFQAEPEYCPFGAEPAYHAMLLRRFRGEAHGVHYVVELEGRIRGLLGCWIRDDLHTPPASAGMDLLLGRELRGKGLSWVAYRRILEEAFPRGAAWIKGTTGQPGVIRAARAMGRVTTGIDLVPGAVFPPGWFDEALTPEAIGPLDLGAG